MAVDWVADINIAFTHWGVEADTEEEAIEEFKVIFLDQYNITLEDEEISNVKRMEGAV